MYAKAKHCMYTYTRCSDEFLTRAPVEEQEREREGEVERDCLLRNQILSARKKWSFDWMHKKYSESESDMTSWYQRKWTYLSNTWSWPRGEGRQQDVSCDGSLCLTRCKKHYFLSDHGKVSHASQSQSLDWIREKCSKLSWILAQMIDKAKDQALLKCLRTTIPSVQLLLLSE